MSADLNITISGTPVSVYLGENTAEALRYAAISEAARDAIFGAFPTYANTTDGLAATASGDFFTVVSGGIVTVYKDNAGSAVAQYSFPTSAALAAADGPEFLGFAQPGSGAILRASMDKLLDVNQSVEDYGATVASSAGDNTTAFNAAIAALPADGGTLLIGGSGDYDVTAASIVVGSKKVRWEMPRGANVNGSQLPEIPGEWVTPDETVFFVDGGSASTFQYGFAHRTLLQAGALGHFEAAHFECDARSHGTASKFYVGLNAVGSTDSTGNVFGLNGYARATATAASTTEVCGAELNTDVRAAVARKTGLQVVDVATSTGAGGTHYDAAMWVAKQTGAVGYQRGIQFGYGTDENFPLYGSDAAMLSADIATQGGATIGYGVHAGKVSYSEAFIQMRSQYVGHHIGWAAAGGNGTGAGKIESSCTADDGGAIVFKAGGMALQGFATGALFTAFEVLADGTNAISMLVGGSNRQVLEGANDSGGTGYRMLRMVNH